MTDRQDEPISIRPDRIVGIKTQEPLPQAIHHRRHRHRCAGVTRVGLLDRIHRQRADRVDAQFVETLFSHHNSLPLSPCHLLGHPTTMFCTLLSGHLDTTFLWP